MGMYGLTSLDDISAENWNNVTLSYGALDLNLDDNRSGKINVTSK
jgi:hypothetical protein